VLKASAQHECPWLLLQRRSRVEKDVRRTDRGVPFFAGSRNPNVAMLRRILLTYSIYNFDLSYCQARLVAPYTCLLPSSPLTPHLASPSLMLLDMAQSLVTKRGCQFAC
jgi:Rab-GTPase-TBC domain